MLLPQLICTSSSSVFRLVLQLVAPGSWLYVSVPPRPVLASERYQVNLRCLHWDVWRVQEVDHRKIDPEAPVYAEIADSPLKERHGLVEYELIERGSKPCIDASLDESVEVKINP